MKRDMDLVRRIAFATEALPFDGELHELPGVAPDSFTEHVRWMREAGLIEAALRPMGAGAIVTRLTWAGCEFADAARSDTLWAKAKTSVIKPGTSFSFDLLKEWLKTEISKGFPTLGGLG